MGVHANAKLGPAGRREVVRLIREGASERQAAACLSVAPATAHRWSIREREAGAEDRASGAWAVDRPSRPRRCPRQTPSELEQRVCAARERSGWGPRLLVAETGLAHSTISVILGVPPFLWTRGG
jgi:transposase